MSEVLQKALLYGICDLGYLAMERAVPVSRELLKGGVGILQLRAKGHDPEGLVSLARELKILCDEFGVPFVVNDHLDVAKASAAHGLHLGQDDGSILSAREELKAGVMIGRSTHSLEQARIALGEGADYIGFGPLFPTPTKKGRPGIGLEDVSRMEAEVGLRIPAFCIGGIKPENLRQVMGAGARRIVMVSHLLSAEDPEAEARGILKSLT